MTGIPLGKAFLGFAALGGLGAFLLGAAILWGARDRAATAPTASSAPAVIPMDKAIDPDDVALRIKNDALERCEKGGGYPAMGFGFTVICLKPQCVDWTRVPGFQPFGSGKK